MSPDVYNKIFQKWPQVSEAGRNNFKMQAVPFQIKAKKHNPYEQRTRIITVESHLEVEAAKPDTSHFDAHFLK